MKKVIFILSLGLIIFACTNSKRAMKKKANTIHPVILSSDFTTYARESSETQINNAVIVDSVLTLSVSYNGGCQKHTFELIGSNMVQKSMPPIRGIMLVHHANNDDCRELVEEDIKFNISAFKYPGSDIVLKLQGYKPTLLYKSN